MNADGVRSCQSIYYSFGNSLGAGRVTECSLVGGVEALPSGINQDFLAAIPDPLRPVVPVFAPFFEIF